jgi:hypothetical protein
VAQSLKRVISQCYGRRASAFYIHMTCRRLSASFAFKGPVISSIAPPSFYIIGISTRRSTIRRTHDATRCTHGVNTTCYEKQCMLASQMLLAGETRTSTALRQWRVVTVTACMLWSVQECMPWRGKVRACMVLCNAYCRSLCLVRHWFTSHLCCICAGIYVNNLPASYAAALTACKRNINRPTCNIISDKPTCKPVIASLCGRLAPFGYDEKIWFSWKFERIYSELKYLSKLIFSATCHAVHAGI